MWFFKRYIHLQPRFQILYLQDWEVCFASHLGLQKKAPVPKVVVELVENINPELSGHVGIWIVHAWAVYHDVDVAQGQTQAGGVRAKCVDFSAAHGKVIQNGPHYLLGKGIPGVYLLLGPAHVGIEILHLLGQPACNPNRPISSTTSAEMPNGLPTLLSHRCNFRNFGRAPARAHGRDWQLWAETRPRAARLLRCSRCSCGPCQKISAFHFQRRLSPAVRHLVDLWRV